MKHLEKDAAKMGLILGLRTFLLRQKPHGFGKAFQKTNNDKNITPKTIMSNTNILEKAIKSKGLFAIGEALKNMHAKDGTIPPSASEEHRIWKQDSPVGEIIWEHPRFGKMRVHVPYELHATRAKGVYTTAQVDVSKDHPPQFLKITIQKKALPGVRILRFFGKPSMMTDITDKPCADLTINVRWHKGEDGSMTAMTRAKNRDNVDIVFLCQDGTFMRLNVGLSTRGGQFFWLTIQEVSMSQVGTTTFEKVQENGLEKCYGKYGNKCVVVVPSRSEDAYPGFNWLIAFKDIGHELVSYALEHECFSQLGKCAVASWNPPAPPTLSQEQIDAGFKLAIVFWFHVAFGGGVTALEDFTTMWTHFKSVVDDELQPVFEQGIFPALQPMTYVAVLHAPDPERDNRENVSVALPLS